MSIYSKYPLGYYVYAYIRNKDSNIAPAGTPYYIGKGKGSRAWNEHQITVPSDKNCIVIMEQNLTDTGALALERRYILWYGRVDIGTGILRNLTDGGDGSSGAKPTIDTIKRRSIANKGKKRTPEQKARISASKVGGKRPPTSKETREKISKSLSGANNHFYGKTHTEETRAKIRTGRRRNPPNDQTKIDKFSKIFEVKFPDGSTIIIKNLTAFCRHIGISAGTLNYAATSGKEYRGFACRRLESGTVEDFLLLSKEEIIQKLVRITPQLPQAYKMIQLVDIVDAVIANSDSNLQTLSAIFRVSRPTIAPKVKYIFGFTHLQLARRKMGQEPWNELLKTKREEMSNISSQYVDPNY